MSVLDSMRIANKNPIKPPCAGCDNRCVGCRSACVAWASYEQKRDANYAARRAAAEHDRLHHDSFQRHRNLNLHTSLGAK